MKTLVIFFFSLLSSLSVFSQNKMDHSNPTSKIEPDSIYFTCVMHPEIHASMPGNCPKCGMTLVKKAIKVATPNSSPQKANQTSPSKMAQQMDMPVKTEIKGAQPATYTCPMHTDETSDKSGKCPKCGMDLKETEKTSKTYSCPMHSDVTSDKPGKCSKCGMDLKKKNE